MGTFRELSSGDVREILGGYGIGDYLGHRAVAAGTINTNFAVEAGGGRLFLRINEGKAREDVEREAAIVSHLAKRGVSTPPPLRTTGGEPLLFWSGVYISLFPWVEGRVLHRSQLEPGHAGEAGRALALLHRAGLDFGDHRPGRYEPEEIHRRFATIEREVRDDRELTAAAAVLGPELDRLSRERRSDLPRGLIHGDLFIDNVLFDASGRLAALIDFEQASWGCLTYDLAVSVLAFGFGQDDFRTETTRAFIDRYTAERSPTAAENDGFAAELRFAACRFAVTRITDVYLRRGGGAPGGKDFRRYLLRLRRVQEHVARSSGLLALS